MIAKKGEKDKRKQRILSVADDGDMFYNGSRKKEVLG